MTGDTLLKEDTLLKKAVEAVQCKLCGTTNPADDVFCENCGARIAELPPAPDSCSCGAPLAEMDADGFCGACGRRLKRPDSDHIELALSNDFAGVSDRGLRHSRNEDRFALTMAGNAYGLVVCDGVSMSPEADQASSAAAQSMLDALNDGLPKHDLGEVEILRSAIRQAAGSVSDLGKLSSQAPSTTLVAAIVKDNELTVGWIGDSRAYWIANGEANQLTRDHSWQNSPAAHEAGAEAMKAANAHALTRWVGADAPDLEPEIVHRHLHAPGLLLLCSDGLWNYAADPAQIAALISTANKDEGSALSISRELIDYAIGRGGHDNITALVLRHPVSEDPSHGG